MKEESFNFKDQKEYKNSHLVHIVFDILLSGTKRTVREISSSTGIPKSTVHRIIKNNKVGQIVGQLSQLANIFESTNSGVRSSEGGTESGTRSVKMEKVGQEKSTGKEAGKGKTVSVKSNSGTDPYIYNINNNINITNTKEIKNKEKISNEIPKHELQEIIFNHFPNVSSLKKQLTYDECEKLILDFDANYIRNMFESMENYSLLAKKSVSVYLTFKNWARRDGYKKPKLNASNKKTFF